MITMYAGRLLGKLAEQTNGEFPISPAVGGNCIGIASCIFSFLAGPLVGYVGRKWIMVIGCFGMGFSHIMAGVSVMQTWHLVTFVCMIAYISLFNLTMANVSFLYTAEVAVDAAAGICIGAQFLNLIQISFTIEYMIDGFLQVYGTFFYFGIICIIGGIFSIIFVKETRGLTDLEKKNLYNPVFVDPKAEETEKKDLKVTVPDKRNQDQDLETQPNTPATPATPATPDKFNMETEMTERVNIN